MIDGSDVVWSSDDDEKTQEGVADLYAYDDEWDFDNLPCGCCSCCGCLCYDWENDDE